MVRAPRISQSNYRSDWRPAMAMVLLALQVALLVGTWVLFFTTERYIGRQLHLSILLLVVLCSAIAAFVINYLWRRALASEVAVAHDRLQLAMTAGKCVGWEWNLATGEDRWFGDLQTVFGIPSDTFTGQVGDFFRYLHPDDRQRISDAVSNARIHHTPYEAEFRVVRPDGSIRWLAARGNFYYSKSGNPERMLGMSVDVTDRRNSAEALRESEERFRRVVQHIGDALIVDNVAGDIIFANDRFLDLFGFGREDLASVKLEDYVAPDFCEEMRHRHNRRMQGEAESTHFQYQGIRADGKRIWLEADVVPILDQAGRINGTQSAIRDITEAKLAEEALATIGRRLIEAHEKERTWIARELHDDINQRIALLAVELEQWKQGVAALTPEFEFHLQQVRKRLFDIAKDVQALSHRLHSSKLEFLGLAVAANSFCQELSEQHKIHISFTQTGVPAKLPTEVSLALFRVLQEALHNAIKHSTVRQFGVELCGRPDEIYLAVTDAGRGFDPTETIHHRGLGLVSMRERVQLVGGRLAIDSSPGRGTIVQAYVPLTPETPGMSIAS